MTGLNHNWCLYCLLDEFDHPDLVYIISWLCTQVDIDVLKHWCLLLCVLLYLNCFLTEYLIIVVVFEKSLVFNKNFKYTPSCVCESSARAFLSPAIFWMKLFTIWTRFKFQVYWDQLGTPLIHEVYVRKYIGSICSILCGQIWPKCSHRTTYV